MERIIGTDARVAGNYLVFVDQYGNHQVRFFRGEDAFEWADLLACVGELKLRGIEYTLIHNAKYQEAA